MRNVWLVGVTAAMIRDCATVRLVESFLVYIDLSQLYEISVYCLGRNKRLSVLYAICLHFFEISRFGDISALIFKLVINFYSTLSSFSH